MLIPISAPAYTLIDAMYKVKKISARMLKEKLADTAVTADDTAAKRDIMSLLVRARTAEKGAGYHMSDAAMMDQVVSIPPFVMVHLVLISCLN